MFSRKSQSEQDFLRIRKELSALYEDKKACSAEKEKNLQAALFSAQLFFNIEARNLPAIKVLLVILKSYDASQIMMTLPEVKENNITPVMATAIWHPGKDNKALIACFTEHKLDFNAQSGINGFTALHFAVERKDLLFVLALITCDVNPFIKSTKGKIPRQLLPYGSNDTLVVEIERKLKQHEEKFKKLFPHAEKGYKAEQSCIIC